MSEKRATSIETIVRDIIDLTDRTDDGDGLHKAWKGITNALGYLSAKDSMFKYRSELKEE